eukprot:g72619.t1
MKCEILLRCSCLRAETLGIQRGAGPHSFDLALRLCRAVQPTARLNKMPGSTYGNFMTGQTTQGPNGIQADGSWSAPVLQRPRLHGGWLLPHQLLSRQHNCLGHSKTNQILVWEKFNERSDFGKQALYRYRIRIGEGQVRRGEKIDDRLLVQNFFGVATCMSRSIHEKRQAVVCASLVSLAGAEFQGRSASHSIVSHKAYP